MFGLIPMVITIILAAIVAGAFAYIGGDIYSDSSITAKANGFVNEGSQVRSAAQLYRVKTADWPGDGSVDTGVAALVSGSYLSGDTSYDYSINTSSGIVTAITGGENADLTTDVCEKIQESATGSATVTDTATPPSDQLFGCINDSAGDGLTFFHK